MVETPPSQPRDGVFSTHSSSYLSPSTTRRSKGVKRLMVFMTSYLGRFLSWGESHKLSGGWGRHTQQFQLYFFKPFQSLLKSELLLDPKEGLCHASHSSQRLRLIDLAIGFPVLLLSSPTWSHCIIIGAILTLNIQS